MEFDFDDVWHCGVLTVLWGVRFVKEAFVSAGYFWNLNSYVILYHPRWTWNCPVFPVFGESREPLLFSGLCRPRVGSYDFQPSKQVEVRGDHNFLKSWEPGQGLTLRYKVQNQRGFNSLMLVLFAAFVFGNTFRMTDLHWSFDLSMTCLSSVLRFGADASLMSFLQEWRDWIHSFSLPGWGAWGLWAPRPDPTGEIWLSWAEMPTTPCCDCSLGWCCCSASKFKSYRHCSGAI